MAFSGRHDTRGSSTLENSAAQLRFAIVSLRNRAESRESVLMPEQNPCYLGWFRAGVKAIQYSVNISFNCKKFYFIRC